MSTKQSGNNHVKTLFLPGTLTSLIILFLLLTPSVPVVAEDRSADLDAILNGVDEIGFPGTPGRLAVYGPDAFPILLVDNSDSPTDRSVLMAGARFGKGRLAAVTHFDYLGKAIEEAQTGQLILNVVRWTAGAETDTDQQSIRVGVSGFPQLAEYLRFSGFDVVELPEFPNSSDVKVYIGLTNELSPADVDKLSTFVKAGGGLVTANIGWVYLSYQAKPGETIHDLSANQLFSQAGITFIPGGTKTPPNRRLKVTRPDRFAHAGEAFQGFQAAANRKQRLTSEEVERVLFTLREAVSHIPTEDTLLRPELLSFLDKSKRQIPIPTKKRPVKKQDGAARAMITLQSIIHSTLAPEEIRAHPASLTFPGIVSKNAKRMKQSVAVDTTVPGWHSTGLYAPPGELITVKVAESATHKGLKVRIGCHSDQLWHLDTWNRIPHITRNKLINDTATTTANEFGGLVYVDVPWNCSLGAIDVEIEGCVQAPHFVLGKTDLSDWRFAIRNFPGPWAELESEKFIITVPSRDIRQLDFPDKLMTFWNQVLDACADLRTIPRERKRPERMVVDVQISLGDLHSGYPIMAHLPHGPQAVDYFHLAAKGNWGFYHELGHNHQHGDWTYNGMGEVTVNLFSLYCHETLNPGAPMHGSVSNEAIARNIMNFHREGKKGDPFLELIPYMQLQREFGWETYKAVFAEYESLPADERPKNDQEKRDQWLVRFSKQAGRNLGPFFSWWKIETTQAARDQVKHLPVWMPRELPR